MIKKNIYIGVLFLLAGAVAGCSTATNSNNTDAETLAISTSFYPLTYISETVGGEHVTVKQVGGSSANAHSFDPQPQDVAQVETADLFFYNGLEFDAWAENLASEKGSNAVAVAEQIDLPELDMEAESHDHDDEEGHEHAHGDIDPHAWLDPLIARQYVDVIEEALSNTDPQNAAVFRENARVLKQVLSDIHDTYQSSLGLCSQDAVIVSHNSFQYVASRYGFTVIPISGLSPDDEPSAKEFAELIEEAEEEGLTYVFLEEAVNTNLANTFAKEANLKTLVLSPIEALSKENIDNNDTYVSILKSNARQLKIGLECM